MIFRKNGRIRRNLKFYYNNSEVEIVSKFTYLGIVFTPGGSFNLTIEALCGQALKGIFKLKNYVKQVS